MSLFSENRGCDDFVKEIFNRPEKIGAVLFYSNYNKLTIVLT